MGFYWNNLLLDLLLAGSSVFDITDTGLDCDMFGLIDAWLVNTKGVLRLQKGPLVDLLYSSA